MNRWYEFTADIEQCKIETSNYKKTMRIIKRKISVTMVRFVISSKLFHEIYKLL